MKDFIQAMKHLTFIDILELSLCSLAWVLLIVVMLLIYSF